MTSSFVEPFGENIARPVLRNDQQYNHTPVQGQKKVLLLGSGYVSAPAVEYLIKEKDVDVTVVSNARTELDNLLERYQNIEVIMMDVTCDKEKLKKLMSNNDAVISLLPYGLHPEIAKLCIDLKVPMVTGSYVTPEIRELHDAAVEAGIIIMNEVGVDPGIDHMLAMECFDEVRNKGGEITSFVSWCGGLPAPEHTNTPLLYKFSWNALGALMISLRDARYLKDNCIVDVPRRLILDSAEDLSFLPGFNIEGIPNRDATVYAAAYGIQTARNLFRGTIRYKVLPKQMLYLKHFDYLKCIPTEGKCLIFRNIRCHFFSN